MYYLVIAILVQFFIFNNLIDLGPNLIYIKQTSSLKYCINSHYFHLYTQIDIFHNKQIAIY